MDFSTIRPSVHRGWRILRPLRKNPIPVRSGEAKWINSSRSFLISAEKPPRIWLHGQTVRGRRVRGNEIGHRFGLTQIHLAIQKRTLGKLSRLSWLGSGSDQQVHQLILNKLGAMTGDLYHMFTGVGVRSLKQTHQNFIQNGIPVTDGTKMKGMGWSFLQVLGGKNPVADGNGLWAGINESLRLPPVRWRLQWLQWCYYFHLTCCKSSQILRRCTLWNGGVILPKISSE